VTLVQSVPNLGIGRFERTAFQPQELRAAVTVQRESGVVDRDETASRVIGDPHRQRIRFEHATEACLAGSERTTIRLGDSPWFARVTHALARSARVPDPKLGWRLVQSPTFDNQFATLEFDGRAARIKIERTVRDDPDGHHIETSLERMLSTG